MTVGVFELGMWLNVHKAKLIPKHIILSIKYCKIKIIVTSSEFTQNKLRSGLVSTRYHLDRQEIPVKTSLRTFQCVKSIGDVV